MLFRPIRTLIIIGIAFVAGIVYEKQSMRDRCLDQGGRITAGLCEK